jgi:hypothetical protein
MTTASPVPDHFCVVHLDLAREAGHPNGSVNDRYTLVLPLGPDGRILEAAAKRHPDFCRVSRAGEDGDIIRGLMRPGSGAGWSFDFDGETDEPELGFRFSEERFVPGEYVSIVRGGDEHTYRVISLQPL